MYTEHERSRTRPRVSRACQRCRIKKAKCDGAKPCRRCNLDKAPCTYKIRRKTESANATQRYTDLLLQHHAALTAGLIELYSRSVRGQKWVGPPVEEINGSPSVHRILEELGVIEAEEEADAETSSGASPRIPPVLPMKMKCNNNNNNNNTATVPKIRKLQRKLQLHAPEAYEVDSSGCSPLSTASTRTYAAPARSLAPNDEATPTRYATQVASPPDSGVPPSRHSSGCNSTPTPWDSPEFADELFTTPVPSPTTSSLPQDYQFELQPPARYTAPSMAPTGPPEYNQQELYAREPGPNSLAMPFTSPAEMEACSAGYFYDATTGGMGVGVYGWDCSVGSAQGFQGYGQEFSSWDSGVFV